jgi:hypothetical protein
VLVRAALCAAEPCRRIANAFTAASGSTIDAVSAGSDKGGTVMIELPVTLSSVPQLESDADD